MRREKRRVRGREEIARDKRMVRGGRERKGSEERMEGKVRSSKKKE